MFILPNGQPISPDVPFELDNISYPANWLRLATPEEREAIGITEVPDPPTWDQRFAWGYAEDGTLIWKDHTELVAQWTAQTRTTAGTLIQPTDWMVIREQDNGTPINPAIKGWRNDLRLACELKISGIEATTNTEQLASFVTSPEYSSWPPEAPEPAPAPEDTITFSGGATGAMPI